MAVEIALQDLAQPPPTGQHRLMTSARRLPPGRLSPDRRMRPRRRHALAVNRMLGASSVHRTGSARLRPGVRGDGRGAIGCTRSSASPRGCHQPVVQGGGRMRFREPRYLVDTGECALRSTCACWCSTGVATGVGFAPASCSPPTAPGRPGRGVHQQGDDQGYLGRYGRDPVRPRSRTPSAPARPALMHQAHVHGRSRWPARCRSPASRCSIGAGLAAPVTGVSAGLGRRFAPERGFRRMIDVPVCSAIDVVDCDRPSTWPSPPSRAWSAGVWLRPFRNLVYAMPPLHISPGEIRRSPARWWTSPG